MVLGTASAMLDKAVPRRRGERWTMVIEGLGDETTAVAKRDWGCHHALILQAPLSNRRSKTISY